MKQLEQDTVKVARLPHYSLVLTAVFLENRAPLMFLRADAALLKLKQRAFRVAGAGLHPPR